VLTICARPKAYKKTDGKLKEVLFSINSFYFPQELAGNNYYLPTDDDVFSIIKSFSEENTVIEEFLSRKYKFKSLWKTKLEFDEVVFPEQNDDDKISIETEINNGGLDDLLGKGNYLCLPTKPKIKGFNKNHFFVFFDEKKVDASKIVNIKFEDFKYFYLYIKEEDFSKKKDIFKTLRSFGT
jgi:hypothetical protein